MGEEEPNNVVEPEVPPQTTVKVEPQPPTTEVVENDKTLIPGSPKKAPLVAVQEVADSAAEKSSGTSLIDRDAALARVEAEKRLALVKAWEESEKSKVENKAYKKMSAVEAWENSKRAVVEAELRKIEEKYERKKAEYAEKMKNKIADIHKEAEEKKAMVEAERGEECLKIEETASKYRARGYIPRKSCGCFGG